MKVKISTIMSILVYHIIFINLYYVHNYSLLVYIFSFALMFLLLINAKYFVNKRYLKINIILFLFLGVMLVSTLYNNMNIHRGILQIIKILEIFLFWEYIHQVSQEKSTVKTFFILTLVYSILNDIIMFIRPDMFLANDSNYLLGNKFQVSYFHILLLAFYMYYVKDKKDKKNVVFKTIFAVLAICICLYTECTTALIGALLFLIIYVATKNNHKKIKPIFIMVLLIVSCSILILFSNIVHLKPIEYIIVNLLHEDITLTGRTYIYDNIFSVIGNKWLLGYGYGNSYDIMFEQLHVPNTQNALLEYWLDSGILGVTLLLVLIYNIFKDYNKNINSIVIYLYVFSILGCIEVTIDIIYIALLAMLNIGKVNKINNEKYQKQNYGSSTSV